MAMAFVEGQFKNSAATGAITPAFANAVATGQLVVAYPVYDVGSAGLTTGVTDNKSNVWHQVPSFYIFSATNNLAMDCWYTVVTVPATAGTYTASLAFNDTAASTNWVVQYFNGFVGTPTIDQAAKQNNASSTTLNSGATGTLAASTELVIAGGVHTSTVSAISLGTGFTNLTTSSVANRQSAMESLVTSTNAAQTGSFTIAAARASIGGVVTFQDVVAGGTTLPSSFGLMGIG